MKFKHIGRWIKGRVKTKKVMEAYFPPKATSIKFIK